MAVAAVPLPTQHPDAVSLHEVDFRQRTGLNGEDLVGATWVATPAGLTIASVAVSGQKTQARISGGTAGTTYRITVKGTSTPGSYVEPVELDLPVGVAA